jgi:hypothetical protein
MARPRSLTVAGAAAGLSLVEDAPLSRLSTAKSIAAAPETGRIIPDHLGLRPFLASD